MLITSEYAFLTTKRQAARGTNVVSTDAKATLQYNTSFLDTVHAAVSGRNLFAKGAYWWLIRHDYSK
jgi:hypothetical protein